MFFPCCHPVNNCVYLVEQFKTTTSRESLYSTNPKIPFHPVSYYCRSSHNTNICSIYGKEISRCLYPLTIIARLHLSPPSKRSTTKRTFTPRQILISSFLPKMPTSKFTTNCFQACLINSIRFIEYINNPTVTLRVGTDLIPALEHGTTDFCVIGVLDGVIKGNTTFADFVPIWKKNYADSNLGAYTRKNYLSVINSQLLPVFGSMELHRIKTMHIVNFMTGLWTPEGRKDERNKPLATNTILKIYKTLKSILDAAEKRHIISTNPIDGVDRPKADKREKRELRNRKHANTRQESEKLILDLEHEPIHWRLYFLGVLLGGFRH